MFDEQGLNQGCYPVKINGKSPMLAGFSKLIGVDDFELENLSQLITSDSRYQLVSAVKEYRCIDLGGVFCTNVHTTYEAGSVSAENILSDLDSVIHDMTSCLACVMEKIECVYENILERCQSCEESDKRCRSLVAFQVRINITCVTYSLIYFQVYVDARPSTNFYHDGFWDE